MRYMVRQLGRDVHYFLCETHDERISTDDRCSSMIAALDKFCTYSCIICWIHEFFTSEVREVSTLQDC